MSIGKFQPAGTEDLCGMNILIVEDHPINRAIISTLLANAGAGVVAEENGLNGYKRFILSDPNCFDLIITDIEMPVMDGFAFAKAIRTSGHPRADIPIFALSANGNAQYKSRAKCCGMDLYMTKPVDPHELTSAIVYFRDKK